MAKRIQVVTRDQVTTKVPVITKRINNNPLNNIHLEPTTSPGSSVQLIALYKG